MYARPTLKLLGDTVAPPASVIVGANVLVKSANSVPPTRTLGLSSGGGVVGVGVTCAPAGTAASVIASTSPYRRQACDRRSPPRTGQQCIRTAPGYTIVSRRPLSYVCAARTVTNSRHFADGTIGPLLAMLPALFQDGSG